MCSVDRAARILVVEDDDNVRFVTVAALRLGSFEVEEVPNGRDALRRFVASLPSPLERREKLEQLRALEAGMRIDVALVDTAPLGVDAPEDLERARVMLAPGKHA